MKVLSIGNSFSEDATRYLYDIAHADGIALETANLYIGGCPLDRHYRNMLNGTKAYQLQYDGHMTGFFVSMEEALLSRSWDVVTLQQVSSRSFDKASYYPYIQALAERVRTCQPSAKLLLHQTWAYEAGSDKLRLTASYDTPENMLADIRAAYSTAAAEIQADGIIPSGELMGKLLEFGISKVHRDTYHASLGLGRYALGLLWYRMLTGNSVKDNVFAAFDQPITAEERQIAKDCVESFRPIFEQ